MITRVVRTDGIPKAYKQYAKNFVRTDNFPDDGARFPLVKNNKLLLLNIHLRLIEKVKF